MNVTAEVVRDLLPLYVAGEGSADTRVLVEAYLRADARLAALAAALRAQENAPHPAPEPPPGAERAALATTRSLLQRRSWLLGFALMFTGLPLSFTFDSAGLRFLLLREAPGFALATWLIAAGLWGAFAQVAHRLRVTGL
jgi:anti-sigma factor RsiW